MPAKVTDLGSGAAAKAAQDIINKKKKQDAVQAASQDALYAALGIKKAASK